MVTIVKTTEEGQLFKLPSADSSRIRTCLLFTLLLFCGTFTFVYWFIFFPLLWESLTVHHVKRYYFNLICIFVFLAWILIMLLCLIIWHLYNKVAPLRRHRLEHYRRDSRFQGPRYEVRSSKVQPETGTEMEVMCLKPIATVAVAVQPQDTPSMYNQHTGRKSCEIELDRQETPAKKPANYKSISSTDSEPSLKDWGILTQSKQSQNIQLRTKQETLPSAQQPDKVIVTSVCVEAGNMPQTSIERMESDGNLFKFPIRSNSFYGNPDGDDSIVHETGMVPFTPDAERLSQNLPEFDDYLHLVDIDPPLSPRDMFFSDLIHQANESDASRRSYCVSDETIGKPSYDSRKSMPLFVFTNQLKAPNDDIKAMEQSVDSDLETFEDASAKTPFQSAEMITTKKPAERHSVPVFKINEDLKIVTLRLINEEKRQSCPIDCASPDAPDQPATARDVEQVDREYKRDNRKPEKLVTDEIQEPRKSLGSQSEYFIANVASTKSVTSEVFLHVGEPTAPLRNTGMCVWQVTRGGDEVDKDADDLDEDVFEEVQHALGKLKHRNK